MPVVAPDNDFDTIVVQLKHANKVKNFPLFIVFWLVGSYQSGTL